MQHTLYQQCAALHSTTRGPHSSSPKDALHHIYNICNNVDNDVTCRFYIICSMISCVGTLCACECQHSIAHVLFCHATRGHTHTHTHARTHVRTHARTHILLITYTHIVYRNVVAHIIPLEVPTSTAEYMYRQVHATSLPANILHITCLSSCIQWLQEATPSTPLPLAV